MNTRLQRIIIFLLRISIGWVFLFAALRQIPDSAWSAVGFLENATTFPAFFAFFASPEILPVINVVIPWMHLLIGVALIAGIGVRLAAFGGGLLMLLYYLPRLDGFMVGPNNFVVEYHLVYMLIIVYLALVRAGRAYGLEGLLSSRISKYPFIRALIS